MPASGRPMRRARSSWTETRALVIGYGAIGKAIGERLRAFGASR